MAHRREQENLAEPNLLFHPHTSGAVPCVLLGHLLIVRSTLSLLASLFGKEGDHVLFWAFSCTPELRIKVTLGLFGRTLCKFWAQRTPTSTGGPV